VYDFRYYIPVFLILYWAAKQLFSVFRFETSIIHSSSGLHFFHHTQKILLLKSAINRWLQATMCIRARSLTRCFFVYCIIKTVFGRKNTVYPIQCFDTERFLIQTSNTKTLYFAVFFDVLEKKIAVFDKITVDGQNALFLLYRTPT
jgi:hypothetical protein